MNSKIVAFFQKKQINICKIQQIDIYSKKQEFIHLFHLKTP